MQSVRLPEADRVDAIDARLDVGVRAPQRVGNESSLRAGVGTGEIRSEEGVDPGVDDERVVVVGCGLADRPKPLRVPVGIPEPPGGRDRCPRGCSRPLPRSATQPRARAAPCRSRPPRRPSRAPRPLSRSGTPRRASRRQAPAPRPQSPTSRPRPRWWSQPPGTRPRPRSAPSPHPRRWGAGGGHRDGAATAAGRNGYGDRWSVRGPCGKPTPARIRRTRLPAAPSALARDNARKSMLDAHRSSGVGRSCRRARRARTTRGGSARGPESRAGPPRRGGGRQDRPAPAPVGSCGRMPDRPGGRRRVRDGARVRRPACAVRADARRGSSACRARSAMR